MFTITNRTLNLVHHIFNTREEKVKVIYNSWCQEPRKAYRLVDKKQFKEELIKRLKSGKNCVAFCGTKKFADESGQADGWSPKNSVIKGPFIRAKHMQAEVGSSMGVLDSKHLTNRQYNAYLDESWTFGTM